MASVLIVKMLIVLCSKSATHLIMEKIAMFTRFLIKIFALTTLLVPILLITGRADASPILANGSFETPTVGNYQEFVAPSTGITGWTITSGTVDLSATFNYPAFDGNQSVDLAGSSLGTIQQQFSTVAGQSYNLLFYYSNNANYIGNVTANVSVTGVSTTLMTQGISHSGATLTNMNWQLFSGTFVADGNSATLQFQATSQSTNGPSPGTGGITIDAVSVSALPEPSTLMLLAIGAIGLCASPILRRDKHGMQSRQA